MYCTRRLEVERDLSLETTTLSNKKGEQGIEEEEENLIALGFCLDLVAQLAVPGKSCPLIRFALTYLFGRFSLIGSAS